MPSALSPHVFFYRNFISWKAIAAQKRSERRNFSSNLLSQNKIWAFWLFWLVFDGEIYLKSKKKKNGSSFTHETTLTYRTYILIEAYTDILFQGNQPWIMLSQCPVAVVLTVYFNLFSVFFFYCLSCFFCPSGSSPEVASPTKLI